jgi:hypothetical protein
MFSHCKISWFTSGIILPFITQAGKRQQLLPFAFFFATLEATRVEIMIHNQLGGVSESGREKL